MIDFVRRTKFDLYQSRSPPFGRPKLSKEGLPRRRGEVGEEGELKEVE
jgi:hypothetical protein